MSLPQNVITVTAVLPLSRYRVIL